jgi:hypothetical protein
MGGLIVVGPGVSTIVNVTTWGRFDRRGGLESASSSPNRGPAALAKAGPEWSAAVRRVRQETADPAPAHQGSIPSSP